VAAAPEPWDECDACHQVFARKDLEEYCTFRGTQEEPPDYVLLCALHHPHNYEGPEA